MLQNVEVLDLKEQSAIAVCQKFFDSIPKEMYLAKGCKECKCNNYEPWDYEMRTQDPNRETWACIICNFPPWLEQHQLPKELEGYCMNVLKNWKHKNLYKQEFLLEGEESRLGEWEISDEDFQTGDDLTTDESNGSTEWEEESLD